MEIEELTIPKLTEEWRPVPGYEGLYEVSSFGRIRRPEGLSVPLKGCKVTRPIKAAIISQHVHEEKSKSGGTVRRSLVTLHKDGRKYTHLVHRLVALAFLPCEQSRRMQVNHIDGNMLNNRLDNLEWLTQEENDYHAIMTGLCAPRYRVLLLREEDDFCELYLSMAAASRAIGHRSGFIGECRRTGRKIRDWDGREYQVELLPPIDAEWLSESSTEDPQAEAVRAENEENRKLALHIAVEKYKVVRAYYSQNPSDPERQLALDRALYAIYEARTAIPHVLHCARDEDGR